MSDNTAVDVKLYDATVPFDASIARNKYLVPLVLHELPPDANGAVAVDYAQVPVDSYDAEAIKALRSDDAQARLNALVAKYDGVTCERTTGAGREEDNRDDGYVMGADWPLVNVLLARGASLTLAHAMHAPSDTTVGSIENATKSTDSEPAVTLLAGPSGSLAAPVATSEASATFSHPITNPMTIATIRPSHVSRLRSIVEHVEKDFGRGYHGALDELSKLADEIFHHRRSTPPQGSASDGSAKP